MGFTATPSAPAKRDDSALAEEGAMDSASASAGSTGSTGGGGSSSSSSGAAARHRRAAHGRSSGALCTPRRFLLVFVLLFAVSTAVMLVYTLTSPLADAGS